MTTLVLAEHDNKSLNEATAKMRDAGNSDHGAMQMDSGSRGPTQ